MINFTRLARVHETHLFKSLLAYLEKEQSATGRKISKIYCLLSEFGGISREHFLEHFKEASAGTPWQCVEIEISKIPFGPEFQITKIEFE